MTMGPIRGLSVLAALLLAMGASGVGFAQEEAVETPPDMGAEAERAIDLAVGELAHLSLDPADYRLVEVSLQYHTSPSLWRVTFKPVALMPTPERLTIGAGGEVFVNVDLDSGEIVVTYGE
jgi:hypothetical protein